MTISTRQASRDDVEAIAHLFDAYRQFYAQPPSIDVARGFIGHRLANNQSVIFVAEDSGRMIGFCQLYPSFCSVQAAPIYTLYDLFVQESERKSGAGRQLITAAEAHARSTGAVRLDLTTAKDNLRAQSVYEALDWVRDDVFYTYQKAIR